MRPLVSMIVPVYNVEKYLTKCVESIINQTYSNLEIILVDDGSTDSSFKISGELAKKDERIRVLHKKNGGVSSARNLALCNCHGEYIGFVDSDDCIKPNMVECLVNTVIENNTNIAMCGYNLVTNDKKTKCVTFEKSVISSDELLIDIFTKRTMGVLWNKLFSRELLFSDKRILFDEKIHLWEDILFLTEVCKNQKIALCEECLYNYYVRGNTLSHNLVSSKHHSIVLAYDKIFVNCLKYYPTTIPYANVFILNSALWNKTYIKNIDDSTIKRIDRTLKRNYKYCSREYKIRLFLCLCNPLLYRIYSITKYVLNRIYVLIVGNKRSAAM